MHSRAPAAALLAASLWMAGCSAPELAAPPDAADGRTADAPAVSPVPPPGAHVVRGTAPRAPNNGVVIVTLTPDGEKTLPAPDEQPEMDQVNLTFVPAVLLVLTGHPVKFLNNDDVLHNVRVREEATRDGAFNVAIPTGGEYTFTFPRDGFYIVGCDIHPGMAAAVFAASTPYVVVAEPDGSFSFPDVEPGGYALSVFAGESRYSQPVMVAGPVTEATVAQTASTPSSE